MVPPQGALRLPIGLALCRLPAFGLLEAGAGEALGRGVDLGRFITALGDADHGWA